MPRKAQLEKAKREPKFKVRKRNRCSICGLARAYIRRFGLCRMCFRKLASEGKIPGVRKASW
jgi:small subunit ribosomal protein S14